MSGTSICETCGEVILFDDWEDYSIDRRKKCLLCIEEEKQEEECQTITTKD